MSRVLYLLAGALLMAFIGQVQAETISLRADHWCPYNCDPKSDAPGYVVELAKAAFEPAGHLIDYATLNWARAIAETRDGKFTGIVGAAHSDAPDFVFPSEPLGMVRMCFFTTPTSSWTFKDMDSLQTITLGVIKDYSYDDAVDAYIKANAKDPKRIDMVAGDVPLELNLKKLRAGRMGAFIEDESVLKNHLFNSKSGETPRNAGCVKVSELYIAFSPKNPQAKELSKTLSEKVKAMRQAGTLQTLLAKYGVSDWVK